MVIRTNTFYPLDLATYPLDKVLYPALFEQLEPEFIGTIQFKVVKIF